MSESDSWCLVQRVHCPAPFVERSFEQPAWLRDRVSAVLPLFAARTSEPHRHDFSLCRRRCVRVRHRVL